MDLNEIRYFKSVAENGSFTRASAQTGVPKSTLSRKVYDLETRLGVTLIRRTTRQVKLTQVGSDYLKVCQKALSDLENIEAMVLSREEVPHGKLRVAAPVDIGTTYLAGVATEFHQKYPGIEIQFLLEDRMVDLIEEKIDLAVRAGHLPDSSLKAQKIGTSEFQLVASPAYLKKWGEPKHPKELESHALLTFSELHSQGFWVISNGASKVKVKIKNHIESNQLGMVKTLAVHGAGIGLIPVFLGYEDVKSAALVPVLKGWGTDREPIHVVYPDQPYLPQRTKLFLNYLKKAFTS